MKISTCILFTCIALLIVAGAAVHCSGPGAVLELIKQNAMLMAAAPVIVSSNITPGLINDMKVKYGKIKIITVVVEPPVYDIDQISVQDSILLQQAGLDYATIINTGLSIEDRLRPLNEINNQDGKEKKEVLKSLSGKYTGKFIDPGEQYQFLVKRPDRGLIKMLLPLAESKKIDEFSDKAVKNMVVGGDKDALEDGIVFMGVIAQLKQMISPAQSFLANA